MFDLVIANGTIVLESGCVRGHIGIRDGRIAVVASSADTLDPGGGRVIDASDLVVMPGMVDPHAHIGLGGGEDWDTETASALHGGVTTVFNYVMGSESYDVQVPAEHEAARSRTRIDYGLHIVPCTDEHLERLTEYASRYGVTSFKYFMSFRGSEGAYLGVTGTDDGHLFEYLKAVARVPGGIACVHAENIEIVWRLREAEKSAGGEGLAAWGRSRPDFVEAEATGRAAYLARIAGAASYFVHTSSERALAEAVRMRDSRRRGDPPVYIETCGHYLTHTEDSQLGLLAKTNPPLRVERDREALWEALANGQIDTVGSDHSGRKRELKSGSVWTSPAGISGIGVQLSVALSYGHHQRGLPLERIAQTLATNPAKVFGVYPQKGTIRPGSDADLVLVDLNERRTATPDSWGGNAHYNLYEGQVITGWPVTTILRGAVAFEGGEVLAPPGTGTYLSRGNGGNR